MTNRNSSGNGELVHITFDEALSRMKSEIEGALSKAPLVIRRYTSHLAASGGKMIRGISLLTCAQNQENRIHENAVKLSAAIEILHLATLVHDDVMDDADIRRGIPTLQKKFGKRTAVICGDYLLCAALKLASDVPNRQDYLGYELPDYMSRVCFGELRQHINNGNFDLTVFQYLKIIAGKTAALFEAAFYAGAALSECPDYELKKYKRLGRCLGMIFQLIDDCMDFEATEDVAQKPVQSDFDQNVVTLPMIRAFQNSEVFKDKVRGSGISRSELNEAVAQSGGLAYTRVLARKYYNKYKKILGELEMTEDKRYALVTIVDKAFRVF